MKLSTRPLAVATLAIALLAACTSRSVSGSYIAHDANEARLLQLTETPDHRLTGTIQDVALLPDGSLRKQTLNVAGAVDGDNITLTLQGPLFSPLNVSGKVVSGNLSLTWPGTGNSLPTTSTMTAGDASEFTDFASKLSSRGAAIVDSRNRLERAKQLNTDLAKLNNDLQAFTTAMTVRIVDRANHPIDMYKHALDIAHQLLARERADMVENSMPSRVDAMQRRTDIMQLQVQFRDEDRRLDSIRDALSENKSRLDARIAQLEPACTAIPPQVVPDAASCEQLKSLVSTYREVGQKAQAAVDAAEAAKRDADIALNQIQQQAAQ